MRALSCFYCSWKMLRCVLSSVFLFRCTYAVSTQSVSTSGHFPNEVKHVECTHFIIPIRLGNVFVAAVCSTFVDGMTHGGCIKYCCPHPSHTLRRVVLYLPSLEVAVLHHRYHTSPTLSAMSFSIYNFDNLISYRHFNFCHINGLKHFLLDISLFPPYVLSNLAASNLFEIYKDF